jgi:hypothetical protein
MGESDLVDAEDVWKAIRAIEAEQAAGTISPAEAAQRIERCRRAVTPRDLWKASGGTAGSAGSRGRRRDRDRSFLYQLVDGLAGLWRH